MDPYSEGWEACSDGIQMDKNPYENCSEKERNAWNNGWMEYFDKWKNRK